MAKKTLKERLADVANEYMCEVAKLLDRNPEDCYWVGVDGIISVADFGDVIFLDFDAIQILINGLPHWIEKYGSREKVAQTVREYIEWVTDLNNYVNGHPRINFKNWMMGARILITGPSKGHNKL